MSPSYGLSWFARWSSKIAVSYNQWRFSLEFSREPTEKWWLCAFAITILLLVHAASELLFSDMLDSYRTSRPEFCCWSFVYEWLAPKQGWPTSREICARNSKNLRNGWICKIGAASQTVMVTSWHLAENGHTLKRMSYTCHTTICGLDDLVGKTSVGPVMALPLYLASRGCLGRSGASCSGGPSFWSAKSPWAERVHLRRKGWVWKHDKHEICKFVTGWSRIQSSLKCFWWNIFLLLGHSHVLTTDISDFDWTFGLGFHAGANRGQRFRMSW